MEREKKENRQRKTEWERERVNKNQIGEKEKNDWEEEMRSEWKIGEERMMGEKGT